MKQKNLFLVCGVPGSGKSTWIRQQVAEMNRPVKYVSRDEIRFSMVKEDEDYFAHEDDVFNKFITDIQYSLGTCEVVFADATHLSEKARNKVLDRLNLDNVDIYVVDFNLPLQVCLDQNEYRKGTRSYVPRSVIRRMYHQYVRPSENEKYHYKGILMVGTPLVEED